MGSENLVELRHKIDLVDQELLQALKGRMEVSKEIGMYKHKRNLKALDEKRWQELIKSRVLWGESLGLSQDFVKKLYNVIHEYSLSIQED